MRPSLLLSFVVCVVCFSIDTASVAQPPDRPNVILMMADDMGWGDISYTVRLGEDADGNDINYNGTPHWDTPNLASMASSGLMFSRMYSQSVVCSPTRASVLTGRAPQRQSIPFANQGKMQNREITVAEYAASLGYRTGLFGKWHLGSMTRDVNDSNRGGPGSFGIYSTPHGSGFEAYYATESRVSTYNPGISGFTALTRYWTGPGVSIPSTAQEIRGDDSAIIARETNEFIAEAVNNGDPFLVVVWFHTPHKPVNDPFGNRDNIAAYTFAMEDLDTAVGQIRSQVQALGVADNTILAFTSDNGPEDGQTYNPAGLRNNKRELHEGGVRVPGIIEWNNTIAAGTTHTPMVTSDYLPTLLDIWGVDPVDDRPLDGTSMTNTIFNDRQAVRNKTILSMSTNGHRSAVGIEGRYKLISTNNGGNWELYDILRDYGEQNELADSGSVGSADAATQAIFSQLLGEYNAWSNSVADSSQNSFTGDYSSRVVVGGDISLEEEPPEFLESGARQNNTPELFIEREYATLLQPLTVDSGGEAGTYDIDDSATLAAGSVVHSYLVHHDPAAGSTAEFEVTFEDRIIGVVGSPDLLAASDSLSFADPNFEAVRGLDADQDSWAISNDGHTISFSSTANQGVAPKDQIDVVQVQESITVLANGTAVPVDGNGNVNTSGFVAPVGPLGPTSGNTWQYGIRERNDAQQNTQLDRRAYSFLRFDVSNLVADLADPNFSATFTADYEGHLNSVNTGFNAELGQVSGSWNTSTAPNAALSTGSTSLGILVTNVDNAPDPTTVTLDITALVRGWADGSIPNHGVTFTSSANIPQAAYFSNATIVTSEETNPPASIDQVRILTASSLNPTIVPSFLLGDVNRDSVVDFFDISPFLALLSAGDFQPEADINESGAVDFFDISPFVAILSN